MVPIPGSLANIKPPHDDPREAGSKETLGATRSSPLLPDEWQGAGMRLDIAEREPSLAPA